MKFTQNEQVFQYEGGIVSFVEFLNKNKNMLHEKPIYFQKQKDTTVVEIGNAVQRQAIPRTFILLLITLIPMKAGLTLSGSKQRSPRFQMIMPK